MSPSNKAHVHSATAAHSRGGARAPTRWSPRPVPPASRGPEPSAKLAAAVAQLVETERARGKLEAYRESPLAQLGAAFASVIVALAVVGALSLGAGVTLVVSLLMHPHVAGLVVGLGLMIPAAWLLRRLMPPRLHARRLLRHLSYRRHQ